MPRAREYATNAERQAAYRRRRLEGGNDRAFPSGTPVLPAVTPSRGRRRWRAMVEGAEALLRSAVDEMEACFEQRSEKWQDSEQGEAFAELIESLQDALSALEETQW